MAPDEGFNKKTPYQGNPLKDENNKVPEGLQNISAEIFSVNINEGCRTEAGNQPVEKTIDLQRFIGLQFLIGLITQHKHQ